LQQRYPLDVHLGRVRTLEQAGIEAPKAWAELRERLLAFLALESPLQERLTAALISGKDPDSIAELRAGALAEAIELDARVRVNRAVADVILHKLLELWAPFAPKAYRSVADRFDAVAKLFHCAVALCDPDANAEQVIEADDQPLRAAWVQAATHAAELDAIIGTLRCAAELAGVNLKDEAMKVALVIDGQGAHRRRVWEGWRIKDGRTRRWGAIAKTGAVIRAADLDGLEPYRQPPPLQQKVENINGMVVTTTVDPADAEARTA
jgi:hypothetical protein